MLHCDKEHAMLSPPPIVTGKASGKVQATRECGLHEHTRRNMVRTPGCMKLIGTSETQNQGTASEKGTGLDEAPPARDLSELPTRWPAKLRGEPGAANTRCLGPAMVMGSEAVISMK